LQSIAALFFILFLRRKGQGGAPNEHAAVHGEKVAATLAMRSKSLLRRLLGLKKATPSSFSSYEEQPHQQDSEHGARPDGLGSGEPFSMATANDDDGETRTQDQPDHGATSESCLGPEATAG